MFQNKRLAAKHRCDSLACQAKHPDVIDKRMEKRPYQSATIADDIWIKTKEESAAIQKELEKNWQSTKDFFGNISKCFSIIQSNLMLQVKIGDKMFQFGKELTPPPYEFNVGENTFRKITKQKACNLVKEHFGDKKLFQSKPVQPQTPYYLKGDTLEVPNIDIEAPSLPSKPVMPDLGINITSITVNNPQLEVPESILQMLFLLMKKEILKGKMERGT
ncbi:hypothetical protein Moror_5126 [Moniliophthora roreri MCA 2997]|uniref:Uncharacterized protein n=1 Tax=Moniliophthora roreri (strain MCA 2997) TaxID=1381753 RepID=V2WGF7_MONRO|nr:hypothetical protein Moror_5126 [Moniliophthora roreri MCA 2997]